MTPFYALLKAKFIEFAAGTDDFDNSFKEVPGEEKVKPEFFEQTGQGKLIKRWREVTDEEIETQEADNANADVNGELTETAPEIQPDENTNEGDKE